LATPLAFSALQNPLQRIAANDHPPIATEPRNNSRVTIGSFVVLARGAPFGYKREARCYRMARLFRPGRVTSAPGFHFLDHRIKPPSRGLQAKRSSQIAASPQPESPASQARESAPLQSSHKVLIG
jgi:hypothetical protein